MRWEVTAVNRERDLNAINTTIICRPVEKTPGQYIRIHNWRMIGLNRAGAEVVYQNRGKIDHYHTCNDYPVDLMEKNLPLLANQWQKRVG